MRKFTPYTVLALPDASQPDFDVDGLYWVLDSTGETMTAFIRKSDNSEWISSAIPVPVTSVNGMDGDVQIELEFNGTNGTLNITGGNSTVLLGNYFIPQSHPIYPVNSARIAQWDEAYSLRVRQDYLYQVNPGVVPPNVLNFYGAGIVPGNGYSAYMTWQCSWYRGWELVGFRWRNWEDTTTGFEVSIPQKGWQRVWTNFEINQSKVNLLNTIISQTYTPVGAIVSGTAYVVVSNAFYTRVGDFVDLALTVEVSDLTLNTPNIFTLSLPVISSFTTQHSVPVIGFEGSNRNYSTVTVYKNTVDKLHVQINPPNTAPYTVHIHLKYRL